MSRDTYTYDVAVKKTDGTVMMVTAQAGSKWEAEDQAHSKFWNEQPKRDAYSARRNYANVRQQVGGVL
jgi:hypothetical protein